MDVYQIITTLGITGVVAGAGGWLAIPYLVRDHTVRRRIYPRIGLVLAVSLTVVVGAVFGQAVAAMTAPKEIQVAAVATVVLLIGGIVGWQRDEVGKEMKR